MRDGFIRFAAGAMLAASCLLADANRAADAVEIVLNDVAADRVERQRRFIRNDVPLAGTPDLAKRSERLRALDLAEGRPIYIRIFKAESELELWMQNSKGTFSRLATYPICHWYGTLGPKLKEGDKQSPEGFYRVGTAQTRLVGRWRKAFNLGFPNAFDQKLDRTGSYILIHGGCSSVGCFAMTDPVQDEIYGLARAALAKGQERFSVHIFPFRMTAANMERYAHHEGAETWLDLKPAYDSFERTHVPPQVAVCGNRYKIADGLPGETGGNDRRLPTLRPIASNVPVVDTPRNGTWAAPACQFDDEERRIAFYGGGTTETSATTTAATIPIAAENAKVAIEPPPRPFPPPKASEPRHPAPVHVARETAVERPAPTRSRIPTRPLRRGAASSRSATAAPAASSDGFGSSAVRGTGGISTHGG